MNDRLPYGLIEMREREQVRKRRELIRRRWNIFAYFMWWLASVTIAWIVGRGI